MDLERLSVRLRPRKGWEAVDLGFVLVRAWWPTVYGAWLAVAAPVGILLAVLLGGWGVFLFWWLLPLAETMPLFVLSRAVFGSRPSLRESLRALPDQLRRALPEIFIRRLNPSRTAALPVNLLEGLEGSVRRRRVAVLSRHGIEASSWSSVFFAGLVLSLLVSLVALTSFLVPSWLGVDWEQFYDRLFAGAQPPIVYDLVYSMVVLVILVVDPLHVASGFALYLAQRTRLEGWDLEIALRRTARRLRASSRAALVLVALQLVGLVGFAGLAPPIHADESSSTTEEGWVEEGWTEPPSDPHAALDAVLARPELQREVTTKRWRLRSDDDEESDEDAASGRRRIPRQGWLGGFFGGVAQVLEVLLWVLLGGALLALVVWAVRNVPSWTRSTPRADDTPDRLFGLDLRAETLPDDVAKEAEALWSTGQRVEALALLYRAALARLVAEGATLRSSFTEADCVRVARRHLPAARAEYFTALTGAWQSAAYAHRAPSETAARDLWTGWRSRFDVDGSSMDAAA
ncbi:MAG: DUF4129 domain-containing protein [Acidobacteriota bacterium]